ncbi:hypothetical protein TeGR_g8447, partial [Tetraparma gracilis]
MAHSSGGEMYGGQQYIRSAASALNDGDKKNSAKAKGKRKGKVKAEEEDDGSAATTLSAKSDVKESLTVDVESEKAGGDEEGGDEEGGSDDESSSEEEENLIVEGKRKRSPKLIPDFYIQAQPWADGDGDGDEGVVGTPVKGGKGGMGGKGGKGGKVVSKTPPSSSRKKSPAPGSAGTNARAPQSAAIQAAIDKWGADLHCCKKKFKPFRVHVVTTTVDATGKTTTRIDVERMFGCQYHHEARKAVIKKHGERKGWQPYGVWSAKK